MLFWSFIPIVVIYGFFNRGKVIDINIHDTYILITNSALIITLSFFLAVLSCIYFLTNRFQLPLNRILSYIHTVITFLGLLLFLFPINILKTPQFEGLPILPEELATEMILALLIVISVQILLIINLIIGLINKRSYE